MFRSKDGLSLPAASFDVSYNNNMFQLVTCSNNMICLACLKQVINPSNLNKTWLCVIADMMWKMDMLTHPLWSAARGSLLLLTLIMSREKSRKNIAIPKQTRYTAL